MTLPVAWDAELDARGLLCPLPVLKARKRLGQLAEGAVLRVVADDPAALVDIPHFCAETGHELVGREDLGHPCHGYLIRRRGAQATPRKSSAQ
jgi:tRNA 2-thiouridine synthesizing protein A